MREEIIEIKEAIRRNLGVNSSLSEKNNCVSLRRRLQHLCSLTFDSEPCGRYYQTILRYVFAAEKECPGSGVILLSLFCGREVDSKDFKIEDYAGLREHLIDLEIEPKVADLVVTPLKYSNNSCKISLKKSPTNDFFCELTTGYTFSLEPLTKLEYTEVKNCDVVCIDGYIESVSEVHHLFTHLHERHNSCLLVCRGMSAEVLHTIKVNRDRKTMIVYPFLSPFDVENVNTLVDIAIVSGTDVVSSTKGDLISSINQSLIGSIDTCVISGSSVRITNRKSTSRVAQHVEHLKRLVQSRPEIEEIISKRIRSLSASCIDIAIPEDINTARYTSQIDECIRIVNSLMRGTYDPQSTAKKYNDSLVESLSQLSVY